MGVCCVLLLLSAAVYSASGASYYRETLETSVLAHKFERGFCYDLSRELKQSQLKSKCKPRETLVDLVSEAPNVVIFPNKAAVKRCDGGDCYGPSSCLPTEVEEVSIVVRKHDFRTNREWCGTIRVKQHIRCKCGCPITAEHCGPMHVYMPNECSCVCKNTSEREKCTAQGRIWDANTCTCNCLGTMECSTGTEWVPSMCRCMRVLPEDDEMTDEEKNSLSYVIV